MTFTLMPLAPYRLEYCAWALKRRPVNAVDRWDGETYSRVLAADGRPTLVKVRQSGGVNQPRLQVQVSATRLSSMEKSRIVGDLEKLLGLHVDMAPFYRFAARDRRLSALAERFRGLKPPRFPSVLEAIVNGIACQQLSLHVGLTLLNRLSERAGLALKEGNQDYFALPDAHALHSLSLPSYRALGFSQSKALAIRSLADLAVEGKFVPDQLEEVASQAAEERLVELKGVGEWTAKYVLLRGLGRTDIFPMGDVGAQNGVVRWMSMKAKPDRPTLERILGKWSPFAGVMYFHLLLNSLEGMGYLSQSSRSDIAA